MGVAGTTEKPDLNGSVRIENGRYRAFGYSFEDIEGTLRLVGSSGEIDGLRAKVADGEAFAAGTFRLGGNDLESYRLAIQGRRISVRAIPALRLIVDADLVVSGGADARQIRGEVTLLRGTYTKDVDVTVSDLLARSRPGAALAAREPWKERTALDVRIVSAASLEVRNNVARLSGTVDLTARGTLADPVLLGQMLLDEGGRVVFSDIRYEIEIRGDHVFEHDADRSVRRSARPGRDQGLRRSSSRSSARGRASTRTSVSDPPLSNDAILGLVLSGSPPDTRRREPTTDQLVSAAAGIVSGAVTGGLTRAPAALQARPFPDRPGLRGQLRSRPSGRPSASRSPRTSSVTSSIALDSSKDPIIRIEWQVTDSIFIQLLRDEEGNCSVTFRRRQRL